MAHNEISAEQKARDLLGHLEYPNAQNLTAGDVVELANLISELDELRRCNDATQKRPQPQGG